MTQIIDGIMMTGDDRANQIIVELRRDREAYEIPSGTKIVGYFMRSDGVTLEIEGSIIETNQAMVVVPALAYQIPGVLSIAIRMFVGPSQEEQRVYYSTETMDYVIVTDPSITEGPNGEEVFTRTTTVYANKIVIAAASCFVQITETDTIIEPGHLIPDIQDVINKLVDLDTKEQAIQAAEALRVTAETSRDAAEEIRVQNENARAASDAAHNAAEAARASAETTRQQQETARVSAETARASAETSRATAETARDAAETARATAETSRVSAETARASAETARAAAETARDTAETARDTAETARAAAEVIRQQQETARQNAIQGMTVDAEGLTFSDNPTATITDVNGHKHIHFGLVPGMPFRIKKTFASVAAMQAYTGTDVELYDMVVIESNVEDPDNAKLYMKASNGWFFVTDLSGATGIQGPRGISVTGVVQNSDYTLTLTLSDGSFYTTDNPVRGVGIDHVVMNSDYTMTIYFEDNTSYTTPFSMRGPKGEPGAGGADVEYDSQRRKLTVLFG